jgi:hypothetical protein
MLEHEKVPVLSIYTQRFTYLSLLLVDQESTGHAEQPYDPE